MKMNFWTRVSHSIIIAFIVTIVLNLVLPLVGIIFPFDPLIYTLIFFVVSVLSLALLLDLKEKYPFDKE